MTVTIKNSTGEIITETDLKASEIGSKLLSDILASFDNNKVIDNNVEI